jgi:hypothetical protein
VLASTVQGDESDIDIAVTSAKNAFKTWSTLSPHVRARHLYRYESFISGSNLSSLGLISGGMAVNRPQVVLDGMLVHSQVSFPVKTVTHSYSWVERSE